MGGVGAHEQLGSGHVCVTGKGGGMSRGRRGVSEREEDTEKGRIYCGRQVVWLFLGRNAQQELCGLNRRRMIARQNFEVKVRRQDVQFLNSSKKKNN